MIVFKKKFVEKLDAYVERKIHEYLNRKYSVRNPWNVQIDSSSFFEMPLEISGGDRIFIGRNSYISKHVWLAAYKSYRDFFGFTPTIVIGNNVKIGNYACITAIDSIVIEDGVLISEYFYVSDHFHGIDVTEGRPPIEQPLYTKERGVKIGANCFIGYRVSVLPGVEIGKHCVVGSHSVVTKSFPDYTMIAGSPAKVIKKYDFEKSEWV